MNKIKNRIVFKIKTSYKLELLSEEIKRLLCVNKNSEKVPKLGSAELVLIYSSIVKNDYQQASNVLFTFAPDKNFRQLINISLHSLIMLNTINAEFLFNHVWFTDQNSKPFEIENNVNMTLFI